MSCSRVCPVEVLCVGKCVYNDMHMQPINIGKLQRYSTDTAFDEGWDFFEAGPDTGKSVGLVGGGPASSHARTSSVASVTRRPSTRSATSSAALNTTGVAPYKMKADRSVEEVEWILGIGGIEVQTGVEGRRREARRARRKARRASSSAWPSCRHRDEAEVLGEDLANANGAVDWIEKMKTSRVSVEGMKHAIVVGGGNTALDAVREARGLGIERVTMLYRGVEAQ